MTHDVFISYSSRDVEVAESICENLEAIGLKCWIAPRNIRQGDRYATAIINGIKHARAFVLVFSSHSNQSSHVVRELERAVAGGLPIFPFRLEDIPAADEIEYFTAGSHWMDASAPPLEKHVSLMAAAIKNSLSEAVSHDHTAESPVAPAVSTNAPEKKHLRTTLIALGILSLAAIASLGGHFWQKSRAAHVDPASTKGDPALRVEPMMPADGTVAISNSLIYEWHPETQKDNSLFEIERRIPGTHDPVINRVAAHRFTEDQLTGKITWRVRKLLTGSDQPGPWSEPRTVMHYRSSLDRIRDTGVIRFGIAEGEGIYVKMKEDGTLTGFEPELLRLIFADLPDRGKLEVNHALRVWGDAPDGLFNLLEKDIRIDLLVSGISILPQRENDYGFRFTTAYATYPNCLVHPADAMIFQDGKLALQRIGVAKGTTNEDTAHRILEDAERIVLFRNYDEILNALVEGEIDGAIMDEPYALQKVAEVNRGFASPMISVEHIDERFLADPPIERIGAAVRRGDNALRQYIDAWLQDEANQPTLEALRKRWIPALDHAR